MSVAVAPPRIDGFEVECVIGAGGMGVVYSAIQLSLGRRVALKVFTESISNHPRFAELFLSETRTLAQLSHPNVIAIHDAGVCRERHYLVMELISGSTLQGMIATGRMGSEEYARVIADVCLGISYVHEQGVIHRDLKPENILVGYNGQIKVSDFGIARLVSDVSCVTGTDSQGTPRFSAPEVLTGRRYDQRADVFSLGATFYYMMTQRFPDGVTPASRCNPAISPEIDEALTRSMRPRADQRQSSVMQLRDELLSGLGVATPSPDSKWVAGLRLGDEPAIGGVDLQQSIATILESHIPAPGSQPMIPVGDIPPEEQETEKRQEEPKPIPLHAAIAPQRTTRASRTPLILAAMVAACVLVGAAWFSLRPGTPPAREITRFSTTELDSAMKTGKPLVVMVADPKGGGAFLRQSLEVLADLDVTVLQASPDQDILFLQQMNINKTPAVLVFSPAGRELYRADAASFESRELTAALRGGQ